MKKKIFVIILCISLSLNIGLTVGLYKIICFNRTTQTKLESIECARMPSIEDETFNNSQTYKNFILNSSFKNKYRIKFDSSVELHYRGVNDDKVKTLPKSMDYSNGVYSIAYTEKSGDDINIVLSIPAKLGNSDFDTTKYVYVSLSEISATFTPYFDRSKAVFIKVV